MKKKIFNSQEKINSLKQEFKGSSDRAAAIIGGAFLEDILETILRYYFIGDKKHDSLLFEGNGILGTFSSKISLAYRIGLISKGEYEKLEVIRSIRNRFAHELSFLNFNEQSIASKCKNIEYPAHMITPDYGDENGEVKIYLDSEFCIEKAASDQPRAIFQEAIMVLMNLLGARLSVLNSKKNTSPPEFKDAIEVANEAVNLAESTLDFQVDLIKHREKISQLDITQPYLPDNRLSDENDLKKIEIVRRSFVKHMEIVKSAQEKYKKDEK